MKKFKLGYPHIDKYISFKKSDFIVIGGAIGMGKTTLALNILKRNESKGCYISLSETKEKLERKLEIMDKANDLMKSLKKLGIESFKNNAANLFFLEFPSLLELVELIVSKKNEFDYFIVNGLTRIDNNINPLFSENKNYHNILRHLKALCIALNKNIILLSNLDSEKIEEEKRFAYHYYGRKEKYIDYLITIHREDYYRGVFDDLEDLKKDNKAVLTIVKSKRKITEYYLP